MEKNVDRQVMADSRGSPWSRIAAVGKRGSCRESQLTGAAANSPNRPGAAVDGTAKSSRLVTGSRPDRTTQKFVAAQTKRLTQTAHESGLQGNAGDSSAPGEAVLA
jgi:hypothetical protein